MTLLNDFYKIIDTKATNGDIRFKVKMNGGHTIYKAHFPNNAVTPGVCLVQMTTELLQVANGLQFELSEILKIKYRNAVKPCDEPWFKFSDIATDGNEFRVRVSINNANGKDYALMTLNYKTYK